MSLRRLPPIRLARRRRPMDPAWLFACLAALTGAAWSLLGAGRNAGGKEAALPPISLRAPYNPRSTPLQIAAFADRARRDNRDWISLNVLSGLYLQECRETGDLGAALRAEMSARRSLAIFTRSNEPARDELAMSLLTQHKFHEALAALDGGSRAHSRAAAPRSMQARMLRAEILLEIGDYDASRAGLFAPGLGDAGANLHALLARQMEIDGDPFHALAEMQKAQAEADANYDSPAPTAAWFHMRVGNILADMGRAAEAERSYREALALFPSDYRVLTSLARLAAGRGDWDAVLQWGGKSAAIVPTPETVALLGDAYTALGRRAEASAQYSLVDTIAQLARAQGAVYDRQRALFCADHDRTLDEGLKLARRELAVRHDVYAYDTLAWVCCRKGLLKEARSAIDRALSRGTRDARMFYHAGCIALAQGDRAGAKKYLSLALEINPYFLPFAPAKARTLLATLDRS